MNKTDLKQFAKIHKVPIAKASIIIADMRHLKNWQGLSLGYTAKIVSEFNNVKITKDCVRWWLKK